MRTSPALALLLFALPAAAGGDASATVEDGVVIGSVAVEAAPEAVRSKLGDPRWVTTLGDGNTEIEELTKDGDCNVVAYVSHHPIATARYRVRQCPAADGYRTSLVESEAFSTYAQSWTLAEEGGGTRVTYRIDIVSTLPVPKWVVRQTMKSQVLGMMERLDEEL